MGDKGAQEVGRQGNPIICSNKKTENQEGRQDWDRNVIRIRSNQNLTSLNILEYMETSMFNTSTSTTMLEMSK